MDPTRFDHLARALVHPVSRRRALAGLLGGLAAGPALLTPPAAQAKHHHKKACTGGAIRCGKGCCAADDACVGGTCYCAASARARARARPAANCTPMPNCIDVDPDAPPTPCVCGAGDDGTPCGGDLGGVCQCVTTTASTPTCALLAANTIFCLLTCTTDADCDFPGFVCIPPPPGGPCAGDRNVCVPAGPGNCPLR